MLRTLQKLKLLQKVVCFPVEIYVLRAKTKFAAEVSDSENCDV